MSNKVYIFGEELFRIIHLWAQILFKKPYVKRNHEKFVCLIFTLIRLKTVFMGENIFSKKAWQVSLVIGYTGKITILATAK